MDATTPRDALRLFDDLYDPRPGQNVMHRLSDLMAMAILATVCGAQGWTDVSLWCRCKECWLRTFLLMPHGVPSHDTFGRVFAMIEPDAFEGCFQRWTRAVAQKAKRLAGAGIGAEIKLVAADGKTIRRSFDHAAKKSAIHMVSAWCEANHMVLGQLATQAKSNEIEALPRLLELLDLKSTLITVDAMHCQKATAETILGGGGHYLMQVKDNQKTLHEDLKLLFGEAKAGGWEHMAYAYDQDTDAGHGRVETRRCWSTWEIDWLQHKDWPGLQSVVCVECERWINGKASIERRYYLSSLDGRDASLLLSASRGHWGVENRLHWRLDVQMGEDDCRIRTGHAAENFSRLRRVAMNLLKQDQTHKVGLKAKQKACGWDHDYLLKIVTQAA